MGYCTLYGDMAGALAPIGDLYKTQVFELARYLRAVSERETGVAVIPERSLTKPPSAELRPHQTDQDSLPPYPLLDAILRDHLEQQLSSSELENRYSVPLRSAGYSVAQILRQVRVNEYKRRQAAPSLRVSARAFGVGRRVPVTKKWEPLS
jgi:NAD+ synthase (glutamine-hydrolysing)